ncbi:hypothetical protein BGW38_002888 [Lunasporangiospora selenospora]|uniref:GPI transamidase component PIG-T n=1 Tax=Lunasporangiospora selenospora TaxID=979761 RepID=A0A9P6KHQ6_9FUNG|nr:hypothetical protein BGW38_002888 [Lunasporangiospora selenospora]
MPSSPSRILWFSAALVLALSAAAPASAQQSSSASELTTPEAFHEELVLKPLNDGSVYSHFQFTTHVGTTIDEEPFNGADSIFSHYSLFPRSVGQILQEFEVNELHLTFTQGRWHYDDWGYPLAPSAGTGVELSAWLKDDRKQVNANWKGLTNSLAGLFCASLNFIDDTITIEPKLSFRHEGLYNVHSATPPTSQKNSTSGSASQKLRYGSLPHENVCTENLTPWIKLLPCKSKAGIASLLKSHKLFDTRFYSMAIHVRPVCEDEECRVKSLELVQSITTVFDAVRNDGSYDWSMSGLFEREIRDTCPLATSSKVVLHLPQTTEYQAQYELVPYPPNDVLSYGSDENKELIAVYDLKSPEVLSPPEPFQISFKWDNTRPKMLRQLIPGVLTHRYFTGYGQERGGLSIEVHNNNLEDVKAIYLDTLPWFLKIYLHTFSVQLNGKELPNYNEIVKKMLYQPAVDRGRPAVLELGLILPAQSVLKFTISFDKVFLKYTEHPPDANRGFDVGYAVLTAYMPRDRGQIGYGGLDHLRNYQGRGADQVQHQLEAGDNNQLESVRVYTETLLLSLPTPDFSMPYNVITLTCTVISLFFGTIFNMMTRSLEVVEQASGKKKDAKGKEKAFVDQQEEQNNTSKDD